MTDENTQTKAWYKSKGVVSGLLSVIIGTLVATGVLAPEAGTGENVNALSSNIVSITTGVAMVITGATGAYGRIKATTKIGKKST